MNGFILNPADVDAPVVRTITRFARVVFRLMVVLGAVGIALAVLAFVAAAMTSGWDSLGYGALGLVLGGVSIVLIPIGVIGLGSVPSIPETPAFGSWSRYAGVALALLMSVAGLGLVQRVPVALALLLPGYAIAAGVSVAPSAGRAVLLAVIGLVAVVLGLVIGCA